MGHEGAKVLELRRPAHLVSGKAVRYWIARAALFWIFLAAIQGAILFIWPGTSPVMHTLLIITAVLALLHSSVMPIWRYRVHRWEATDTAVFTQSGWFNQQWRIAPISRIQTVDVTRGPLTQIFALANVTVTTASAAGPLHIHALDHGVALELVKELAATTQTTSGDAT